MHNVVPTASFGDPQALSNLAALAQPPWQARPVTVTSEQAVGADNKANPSGPLSAYHRRTSTTSITPSG